MARYLVVAHQTADSPGLRQAVGQIARDDPDASFTLLVPATPVEHLAAWTEGESKAVAREAGERARALFEADGARVEDVLVGDRNPVYAVEDAFNHDSWDHTQSPGGLQIEDCLDEGFRCFQHHLPHSS
jgi:hypothetical protein